MTTGINPDVPPVARRWAASILAVPETAPGEEARRAYFKQLRQSDFASPRTLYQAVRVLDGNTGPAVLDEEWLLEEEGRLRTEIESFANEFFSLPAAERRQRWDALLSRCETASPLMARLQTLKAGLEIEVKSLPSGQSRQGLLVEQLLQSFALPPLAQVASRQAFLRAIEEPVEGADHQAWEKAARYLQAEWPALASLDRELVQHIAKLRSRLKRRRNMHQRSQQQRRPTAPAVSRKRSPWWVLVIVISLGGGIIRGLTSSNHSSPPVAPSPSFFAPHGGTIVPGLENRAPIDNLLDATKYDVEVENAGKTKIFRFTPCPNPMIVGKNGPPLYYDETALRLIGFTQDQINALFVRAITSARRPIGALKSTQEDVRTVPPGQVQGGKAHP